MGGAQSRIDGVGRKTDPGPSDADSATDSDESDEETDDVGVSKPSTSRSFFSWRKDFKTYHFSNSQFQKVCELSEMGNLSELKRLVKSSVKEARRENGEVWLYVGTSTFFPSEQSPSPVVLATQYGHVEILEYFRKMQSSRVRSRHRWSQSLLGFDYFASAYFYHRGNTHVCTPLFAACRSNRLEAVEKLLLMGANVNIACKCCEQTPLHIAIYLGMQTLPIVETLCMHRADPTVVDKAGVTAFSAAIFHKHCKIVDILLLRSDPHVLCLPGLQLTPVHMCALVGDLEITRALMRNGASPCHRSESKSVPSPIFLAASLGYSDIVEEFLKHSDCTSSIRTDAFNLLGPPCQRKEDMVFDDTLSSTSQNIFHVYYQCSELQNHIHAVAQTIGARGMDNLPNSFHCRAENQFTAGNYQEAEIFWTRLANLFMVTIQHSTNVTRTWMCLEGMVNELAKKLCSACNQMVSNSYQPQFSTYAGVMLKLLPLAKQSPNHEGYSEYLRHFLLLMATWCTMPCPAHCSDEATEGTTSEREVIGSHLVDNFLHANSSCFGGPYLLYFFLCRLRERAPHFGSGDRDVLYSHQFQTVFLEALLRWGCSEVINSAIVGGGKRFLHFVASYLPHLVPTLLAYGAHLDAVNCEGKTAAQVCSVTAKQYFEQNCPISLTCLSCRAIASYHIPHQVLKKYIPQHLISLIMLHDSTSINVRDL